MKKEIKISLKNDIKRFEIPTTYKALVELIKKCFKQLQDSHFQITYEDDEKDKIVISNEFDLEQVIMFMDKQRITLLRAFLDLSSEQQNDTKLEEKHFGANLEEVVFSSSVQMNSVISNENELSNLELKIDNNNSEIIINEKPKEIVTDKNQLEVKFDEIQKENFFDVKQIDLKFDEIPPNKTENEEKHQEKKIETEIESIENKKIDKNIKLLANEEKSETYQKLVLHKIIEEEKLKPNDQLNHEKKLKNMKQNKKSFEKKIKKEKKKEKMAKVEKDYDELKKLVHSQNKDLKEYLSEFIENKFSKLNSNIITETIKKNTILEKTFESFQQLSTKNNQFNKSIIHSVTCKGCEAYPINGIRYECSVCKDFDFCESCEEIHAYSHNHPFLKIRIPLPKIEVAPELVKVDIKRILSSKCLSENNSEIEQGQKQIIVPVILHNDGDLSWQKDFCVINIHGFSGDKVKLNQIIKPGETFEVPIVFSVEKLGVGDFSSRWILKDEKDCSFGSNIDIRFKITQKKEIVKKQFRFRDKLKFLKDSYYLEGIKDEKILEALELTNGNPEEAIIHLL